ncbi:MAG TPA: carbohydrate porin [Kofleriaceae bacterium]|nr:carbohydrate porin [Kofleriaceae bacterium]
MRWGIAALLVLLARPVRADEIVDPCACSPNKPHFHRASALTGDWGGGRQTLLDHGIKLQGTYAPELFAAPGLDNQRLVEAGLFTLAVDVDLAKLAHEGFGTLHVSGLAIHGHGISEQLMDIYGVSNNAAPQDLRLFEAWYEQAIGPLSIRAGQLSADQEYILAEHSTVLMSGTFGIVAVMTADTGGPVYPIGAPGVSAHVDAEELTVRAAIYDGEQHNTHGIPTQLEHSLAIGELAIAGVLQVGAWHHSTKGNGYYAILDHQLEPVLGAFSRIAISPDAPVSLYMDTGVRLRMGPWRPRDFASAGIAFAKVESGNQTLIELTYQILVRGWLTIQPDVQLVLQHDREAAVIATRAVIAL